LSEKKLIKYFGYHNNAKYIDCFKYPTINMLGLSIIGQKIHYKKKHIMYTFQHPKVKDASG
jgi:hypothetical protein